ncbi:unnamed protein product [Merluccius merluccius]
MFQENKQPPLGSTHHKKGFRVYRDPTKDGYTTGFAAVTGATPFPEAEVATEILDQEPGPPSPPSDWCQTLCDILGPEELDVSPATPAPDPAGLHRRHTIPSRVPAAAVMPDSMLHQPRWFHPR